MATIDDPRVLVGAEPIPGDAPSGVNIRYEPEFTALQEQVARMETEGPLVVNWKAVGETGCDLLRTRSKDLLIGAYVTLALARTEGYRGLGIGLAIVAGMIDAHWLGLEPPIKRERARVQMLEWIVARVTPLFAEKPPAEAEWNDVIAAHEAIAGIETQLDAKLTKETAALGDLSRLLREHARTAERELAARAAAAEKAAADAAAAAERAAEAAAAPPPPPPSPASVAAPPASAVPAPAAVAAPASAADVDVALSRLQNSMQAVALGVLAADSTDPRAYTLLRAAAWCSVRGLPMQTNGVTPLPPLPADRIGQIAMMQQAGNHAGAIALIEQTIPTSPFWLDGHRLVCASLQALGTGHDAPRAAVIGALAALLRRLDGLADLAFSNRAPFADEETRRWIASDVLPSGDGGGSGGEDDGPAAGLREARRLSATGKPRDGLAALAAGATGAASLRIRAEWQIAMAELCLGFNMIAIALPLLEHLDGVVAAYRLEEWDPAFAVRVSKTSHQCLLHPEARNLRKEDDILRSLELHRGRMSRLDVVAAADALKL